ncbi:CHAT domain-containing protein [Nocardia thailandica]
MRSELFGVTGDSGELEVSADCARRALEGPFIGEDERTEVWATAASILLDAHAVLDRPDLLRDAIDAARNAVEAGSDARYLLATALRIRYESDRAPADLVDAERYLRPASAEPGAGAEEYAELAHIRRLLHEQTGEPEHAYLAAEAAGQAVACASDDESIREHLSRWAGALLDSYYLGRTEALAEAVDAARAAVAEETATAAVGVDSAQTATMVLGAWAIHHRDAAAAEEARQIAGSAVDTAADELDSAIAHDALSTAAYTCYQLTGHLDLLDQAVVAARRACSVRGTPPDDLAGYRGNLGATLYERYLARGVRGDLNAAICWSRRAVGSLDEAHPDHARFLNNLGVALRARYELTGDLADLTAACAAAGSAVELSRETPSIVYRMSNLATALLIRYERLGDPADLDTAVDVNAAALDLLPRDSADLPALSANHANILRRRHERFGVRTDLLTAVAAARRAEGARPGPTELADVLDACALALDALAVAEDDPHSAEEAIEYSRRAVTATNRDDPRLPGRLGNLVSMLRGAHDSHRAAAAEAAASIAALVHALPARHPERAGLHSNLALAYHRADQDDPRAKAAAERAVAELDSDHPDRAQLLINLAAVLTERSTASEEDVRAAASMLRDGARHRFAPPAVRWRAALAWGGLAEEAGDLPTAAEAYTLAVELLALVSPERLGRADAQRRLAEAAGLASRAAALLLSLGEVGRAVGVLELGRGVLVNRTLRGRRVAPEIRAALPDLTAEFERLRAALDRHGTDMIAVTENSAFVPDRPRPAVRSDRGRLAQDLDDVVNIIRSQGFPDFQRPPAVATLTAGLGADRIVVVNLSSYRCDAIVVGADGVELVELPDLVESDMDRRAAQYHSTLAVIADPGTSPTLRRESENHVADTHSWLWKVLAEPVLHRLPPGSDSGELPRVTWLTTGSSAFLPVHAAVDDNGVGVLDRVISSYTPTLQARQSGRTAPPTGEHVHAVVLSTAAGDPDLLPAATTEAYAVAGRHGVEPLDCAECAPQAVLAAISACTHVHIALHAVADLDDPGRSGFLLPDGLLTVAALAAHSNSAAVFAYLSACETTVTSVALSDEAVHLTSAFQLIGFRAVIGTLWAVTDRVAAVAARRFYRELDDTPADVALATHRTISWLRTRYSGAPSAWAAFHHSGS